VKPIHGLVISAVPNQSVYSKELVFLDKRPLAQLYLKSNERTGVTSLQ
jgi:hypothetical protein